MCTLTYLPYSYGFVIGNSRDVSVNRADSLAPETYTLENGKKAVYAQDKISKGTWLATSAEIGKTVCLLNGGLVKHTPEPSYQFSRGTIPLKFLASCSLEGFLNFNRFEGYEPFTLIVFDHKMTEINEIVWTGKSLLLRDYPSNQPKIWSSSTLYSAEDKQVRNDWFFEALSKSSETDPIRLLSQFHHEGGNYCPDLATRIKSFRLNGPVTVSISTIRVQNARVEMNYENLMEAQIHKIKIAV